MLPAIINTIEMTLCSLIVAVPLGICTAIYLVEYAKKGNKVVLVGFGGGLTWGAALIEW